MSLETMKTRLDYAGGENQVSRMNEDKLRSLKKAMAYSYQSATATLKSGKSFKCLINPDKLKNEYDNKIISIPYSDVCLETKEEEEINLKAGDIFTWKENQTKWLVYLQRLEETAYFRAEIRRCSHTATIDGVDYDAYICGPTQDSIAWQKFSNGIANELNYTLEMYITKNEDTLKALKRFAIIKVDGMNWEVQAVDSISADGIIVAALKEHYENSLAEAIEEEQNDKVETDEEELDTYINGLTLIYPYDERTYTIVGAEGGQWSVSNTKVQITSQTETTVNIYVSSGKSGKFNLIYSREGEDDIILPITIDSL